MSRRRANGRRGLVILPALLGWRPSRLAMYKYSFTSGDLDIYKRKAFRTVPFIDPSSLAGRNFALSFKKTSQERGK